MTNPNLSRLRAPNATNQTIQTLKPIAQEIDAKIANTLIQMQGDGKSQATILSTERSLKQLARHCDLSDPEDVRLYISTAMTEKTRQMPRQRPLDNVTKNKLVQDYNRFCTANQIKWKRPYYTVVEKLIPIPTPDNVHAK